MVVVVLHLGFLQIIVSNYKDYSEVPVRFVSWFFHLERTDPIGYKIWRGMRLLLFLPVGRGKGPDWSLGSNASRDPARDG